MVAITLLARTAVECECDTQRRPEHTQMRTNCSHKCTQHTKNEWIDRYRFYSKGRQQNIGVTSLAAQLNSDEAVWLRSSQAKRVNAIGTECVTKTQAHLVCQLPFSRANNKTDPMHHKRMTSGDSDRQSELAKLATRRD